MAVRPALVRNDDLTEAVLENCDAGDLVLMEGAGADPVTQILSLSAPQNLMDRGAVPVIMFRIHADKKSGWLARALALR